MEDVTLIKELEIYPYGGVDKISITSNINSIKIILEG